MPNDLTPMPSARSLSSKVVMPEERIAELHGALVPVDGHPTRFCVPQAKAATIAERRALSAVAERLERERRGCANRRHIEVVISRVLMGFEIGRQGDEDTQLRNAEYVEAMVDVVPLSAIQAAADRFRRNETLTKWNRAYRPNPAEFVAEAKAGMVESGRLLVHVRRILNAEVIEPASKDGQAKVHAAATAWLKRDGVAEAGGPSLSQKDMEAAREEALHEIGARFRNSAEGGSLSRLAARLGGSVNA